MIHAGVVGPRRVPWVKAPADAVGGRRSPLGSPQGGCWPASERYPALSEFIAECSALFFRPGMYFGTAGKMRSWRQLGRTVEGLYWIDFETHLVPHNHVIVECVDSTYTTERVYKSGEGGRTAEGH